jgi:hypothetical protein
MWGNRLGWTISACIVLATAAMLFVVARASQRTPPTAFAREQRNFVALELPEPPAVVIGNQAAGGDAGPLYRKAIETYLADRVPYDTFADSGRLESDAARRLAAVDLVVQAADCQTMSSLVAGRPAELINYDHVKPALEALDVLGRICVDRLGLLEQRAGLVEDAAKHVRAAFVLGHHLCRERVTLEEFQLGLRLLSKSTAVMLSSAAASKDDARAAALREFDAARVKLAGDVEPVARFLRSIEPSVVGPRTGDVFEMAARSKERMWRVEAMLALGRVRFLAGTEGTAANQRAATAFVTRAADEQSDPIVKAAAIAARDLTVEMHRMQ